MPDAETARRLSIILERTAVETCFRLLGILGRNVVFAYPAALHLMLSQNPPP